MLWLAVQNKLTTQDKIRNWGSYDLMVCQLCYHDMDSHRHLFFKCKYVEQFLGKVLMKVGIDSGSMEWDEIVSEFASCFSGNSIGNVIRRPSCKCILFGKRDITEFLVKNIEVVKIFLKFCKIL